MWVMITNSHRVPIRKVLLRAIRLSGFGQMLYSGRTGPSCRSGFVRGSWQAIVLAS